ncbi:MAG: class I SAM-dependent methyltransferase [Anaerolineales bacterium]|nr:class I SAM-dependent methyltransferase [Anaerolineales bacterium]
MAAEEQYMISTLKKTLINTWFFPRYIGVVYIEPVMREVKSFARGTMLDLGCGTRRYELIFRESVDLYIGLDWPESTDRAFPDVIGDAMNIPFRDASVDVVLATELMEHLPSPQNFLLEVARILREKGTLILSVPFMEPIHEEPRDYYRFTPFSLRLLLAEHGFLIQKMWNRGGWWSVVLGSFVNQSLYNWSTALDQSGERHYSFLTLMVLPICALAQWLAYQLDRVFPSQRYTLGYTLVATRE